MKNVTGIFKRWNDYFKELIENHQKKVDELDKKKFTKEKNTSYLFISFIFLTFFIFLFSLIQFVANISLNYVDSISNPQLYGILSGIDGSNIPLNIIINVLTVATGIYGGSESVLSTLKTLNLPVGYRTELPIKQVKLLWRLLYLWTFLSITMTIFEILSNSDKLNFFLEEIYIGTFVSFTSLMAVSRAPKATQELTVSNTDSCEQPCVTIQMTQENKDC